MPAFTFGAELLTTWRTDAFVPSTYHGKILPGLGSTITASANLVDNNKVVSLASRDVRWFLNGKLLNSGVGLTTVQFQRNPLSLTDAGSELKIFINYNGENLQRFITIPFAQPELVIRANAPHGIIASGSHMLRALLYYWNISQARDINFAWTVNDEPAGSEGDLSNVKLDLPNVGAPTALRLALTAHNAQNDFEFASTELKLIIR